MAHVYPVKDAEAHFTINPQTREIKTNDTLERLIQGDHNSEVYSFEVPKVVEGFSLLSCDRIKVHYINVDSSTKEEYKGAYLVTDIKELDANTLVFTWLVSGNATQTQGSLSFLIEFSCIAEDGTVDYRWNTGIFSSIPVGAGMNNSDEIATKYADIIEQWRLGVENEIKQGIEAVLVAAKESGDFDGPKGDKGDKGDTGEVSLLYAGTHFANALKGTAAGNPIALNDVSPMEHELLVKADGATKVSVYGKNLFDPSKSARQTRLEENGNLIEFSTMQTSDFIEIVPNTTYSLTETGSHRGKFYDSEKRPISSGYDFGKSGASCTFTVPENAHYLMFSYFPSYEEGIQLEVGETVTEFEPHKEVQTAEVVDGMATGLTSVSPNMTLIADAGTIECEYNRDLNKALTILTSPNGTKYKLAVSDDGTLVTAKA